MVSVLQNRWEATLNKSPHAGRGLPPQWPELLQPAKQKAYKRQLYTLKEEK